MPARPVLLAFGLALASTAGAEEVYFTLGAASGAYATDAPAGCTLTERSARDLGLGLGVGYRFDGPFAVEFGYQTFGSLELRADCGPTLGVPVEAPDSGLTATGIGRLEIGPRWALLGRVGAYSWSAGGEGGTEAVIGAGAEYAWRKGMAVRLEYAAYGADLDAVSLAFRIGF